MLKFLLIFFLILDICKDARTSPIHHFRNPFSLLFLINELDRICSIVYDVILPLAVLIKVKNKHSSLKTTQHIDYRVQTYILPSLEANHERRYLRASWKKKNHIFHPITSELRRRKLPLAGFDFKIRSKHYIRYQTSG